MQPERPCEICSHCGEPVEWGPWSQSNAVAEAPNWKRVGRCGCGSKVQVRGSAPPPRGVTWTPLARLPS